MEHYQKGSVIIPKRIHWCWLSEDPLPRKIQRCVDSWRRVMPDYEIVRWDMSRFDIHSVRFVADACAARKWAFAADYIRLYALYAEGGIYLDSDVMVFDRFDRFLSHSAFSSVESYKSSKKYSVQAAIIGAEKGNGWIKACLEHYNREMVFRMKEGGAVDADIIPNVLAYYAHRDYGFRYDYPFNQSQYLKDNIVIYPQKVLSHTWGDVDMRTCAIHQATLSWAGDAYREARKRMSSIMRLQEYLCENSRFIAMLHFKRRQLFSACSNRYNRLAFKRIHPVFEKIRAGKRSR